MTGKSTAVFGIFRDRAHLEQAVSDHSDNSEWTKRGKELLERCGAKDIASTGEASAEHPTNP